MRLSPVRSAVLPGSTSLLIASIAAAWCWPSRCPHGLSVPRKRPAMPRTAVQMRLWVPAYYYPFGPGLREWNRLIASAKAVPIVAIVNPASGPGDHVDTNFAAIIPAPARPGSRSSATSGRSTRASPWTQVKQEVDTFLRFYPEIQGFHFDEQSSDARGVDYYAELYRYVHQRIPGALVLTNPGTSCDAGYAARPASDVICLFERERGFEEFRPPAWTSRFPGSRFCVQAHNVEYRRADEALAPPRGRVEDRLRVHHRRRRPEPLRPPPVLLGRRGRGRPAREPGGDTLNDHALLVFPAQSIHSAHSF